MDIVSFVIGYKNGWKNGQPESQEKEITITENGTTTVKPDENKVLSKVTVKTKVGDGVNLNIAYGDTPPEDTSKLWVKTTKPNEIVVSDAIETTGTEGYSLIATVPTPSQQHNRAASAVVNGKIYVFGGGVQPGNSSQSLTTEVFSFDPETKAFKILGCVLTSAIYNAGNAVVGTLVYIVGGGASDTIQCFDSEAETIVTLPNKLPKSGQYCAVAVGTDIYAYNYATSGNQPTLICLDTISGSIVTTPITFPSRTFWGGGDMVERGGKVFLASRQGLLEIDVVEGTVVERTIAHNLGQSDQAVWCGNKLCMFGPTVESSTTYAISVIYLDTMETTVFKIADLLGENIRFAGAVFVYYEDAIYIFYGSVNNNMASSNIQTTAHEFRLSSYKVLLSPGVVQVKTTNGKKRFNVINTDLVKVNVGVDSVYKGNAEGVAETVEASLYTDDGWANI